MTKKEWTCYCPYCCVSQVRWCQVHQWYPLLLPLMIRLPLFYSLWTTASFCFWQHLSYDVCLEVRGGGGDYQNCTVLYCVLKLCTVISTLIWAALTVLWVGVLSHWAHFTVHRFMCLYFCVFLHTAISHIIVTQWGGPDGIEA